MGEKIFRGILRYALPTRRVTMIGVYRVEWLDMVNVIFWKVFNQILKYIVRMAFKFIIAFEAWLPVFLMQIAVMGLVSAVKIPSWTGIIEYVMTSEAVWPPVNGISFTPMKHVKTECRVQSRQEGSMCWQRYRTIVSQWLCAYTICDDILVCLTVRWMHQLILREEIVGSKFFALLDFLLFSFCSWYSCWYPP